MGGHACAGAAIEQVLRGFIRNRHRVDRRSRPLAVMLGEGSATGAKSLKALPTVSFAGLIATASLLPAAGLSPAAAMDISGAGATFPYPIFSGWADAYQKETGIVVAYYQIGSGAGVRHIQNQIVAFGASDMPLKLDQLDKDGLIQFPSVVGGTVAVVNLEGIKSGDVRLDGATLAKIFLGEIKTWNDRAIVKLNPNGKLPSQPIVVVRRWDDSGTTFVWTNYLTKVSREWASKVGANTSVQWPTGTGANGHEGVVNTVRNTKGAIGYVEYSYAEQSRLATVSMINKDGNTVSPRSTAFEAAAANARKGGRFLRHPNRSTRPSLMAHHQRHVRVRSQATAGPDCCRRGAEVLCLGLCQRQKMAEEIGYVPLPKNIVAEIEKVWASTIKDASGKPLYTLAP
jgi:phosphate transport system substrate-binding protein